MKKINLFIFMLIAFFSCCITANADYEASVITNGEVCAIKPGSTGKCIYTNSNFNELVPGVFWLDNGDEVTVLTNEQTIVTNDTSICSDYYVKVSYAFPHDPNYKYYGYFCNANLLQKSTLLTDELKEEFKNAGFPESYWEKLAMLKAAHPNWQFVAIDTKLDFNEAVNAESVVGKSLIQYSVAGNEGYLSTAGGSYNYYTDKFTIFDGSSWYAANKDAVAYYLDPRNFLIDMYIFQFEALAYDAENQKLEIVENLLNGEYIKQFSQHFMEAATESGVSPVYLSSLAKQEVGGGEYPTTAITGGEFVYNGQTFSSLYNFYNIGATSGADAVFKGLYWAAGQGGLTTYMRPWKTPKDAIVGGAIWISERYISKGQNTSYFKKWNVVHNYLKDNELVLDPYENYTNQYMTNIMAPSSEARSTYMAYHNSGIIDTSFVFYIPVFNNMPEKTVLPTTGNPNNYLSSLKVNDISVEGFDGAKVEYNFYVDYKTDKAKITGSTVNGNATVNGLNEVSLNVGDNYFDIVVTAQNKSQKTYKLNIVRDEQPTNEITVTEIVNQLGVKSDGTNFSGINPETSTDVLINKIKSLNPLSNAFVTDCNGNRKEGIFVTGDIVSITSNGETKTYSIVIKGDVNGNGTIDVFDLLRVQKYILKSVTLNGPYIISADINNDNQVDIFDLLKIQKHILGSSLIEQ